MHTNKRTHLIDRTDWGLHAARVLLLVALPKRSPFHREAHEAQGLREALWSAALLRRFGSFTAKHTQATKSFRIRKTGTQEPRKWDFRDRRKRCEGNDERIGDSRVIF
jgi:hypothetical protein